MGQPSAEIPTIQLPENLGADPCSRHLGELAMALEAFGVPDGMHRVGTFMGLGPDGPPALLAGLGEAHTALTDDIEDIEMARLLLHNILNSQPPGTVRVSVFDPTLTGAFADFSSLGPGLFEHVHAGGLRGLLDGLSKHVATLSNTRNPVGTLTEPWRVVLLMGEGNELGPKERDQISRMIAGGADWGSIIALGVPLAADPWLRTGWPGNLPVAPDPPVPSPLIASRGREIAAAAKDGMQPPNLSVIVPAERWTGSAIRGLRGSMGLGPDGRPYPIVIGDENPHVLVTGTTGAGKTVALNALLTSLTQEYGADELSLMMLDFKEGTGVAGYAPNDRDPTWLPHAMLIGTNVNEDPEFAIKALRYLQDQISIRAAAAKKVGAGDYAGLRLADPTGDWKRIVAVIDEFQVLLKGPYGAEAVTILTDLSQRARSAGVHLLLASQSVDGIATLYAKHGALFTNVSLRIALMGGTMLNQQNNVGATVPKYHAAVNNRMGVGENTIVRVAAATTDEVVKYKREAHQHRPVRNRPPRVFDGDDIPKLTSAVEYERLRPVELGDPKVLFADEFSVEGGSAGIDLTRQPGRNAVVIGQRVEEVARVMDTAARSLAKQRLPGAAEFSFVCIDNQMAAAIDKVSADLREQGHTVTVVRPRDAPKFLSQTSARLQSGDDADHYVFVYGGDGGGTIMDPEKTRNITLEGRKAAVTTGATVRAGQTIASYEDGTEPLVAPDTGTVTVRGDQVTFTRTAKSGRESLREVMERGPENGTWVVGSFSGVNRMSGVFKVSGITNYDSIGAYVAAGVPLTELNPLTPGAPVTGNAPGAERRNRAQFFDRFSGQVRRTVIPYAIPGEE